MEPYTIHICLADDDPDDHLLFSLALEETGMPVHLAAFTHCAGLIEYLNNAAAPPDFIILDMHIPGNEGHECLIRIKNESQTSMIPVVVWSGTATDLLRSEAMKHGAFHYIIKPSLLEDLKAVIQHLLILTK